MNLEPETRRGYYISAEMKKVWAVEMELLNKLLEVCKKHDLRIWAEGGTLLGAVREHGFIPWDDDIDMAMPREDFNRLRELANDEFKTPYFFQCGYTDLFPSGMAKLRKDGTSAIEKENIFKNQHQGIFIDIFPLDVIPDNKNEYFLFADYASKLRIDLLLYCDHYFTLINWDYNFQVIKTILKTKYRGFSYYYKKYEDFVSQYMANDYSDVSLVVLGYHEQYIRNRKWYVNTSHTLFEDLNIPIPSGYHEVLMKQYGDYMIPKHEPAQHNGFEFLSAETSFEVILPILRKKYKKKRWENRKQHIIKFLKLK